MKTINFEDILDQIDYLGLQTGNEDKAKKLISKMKNRMKTLQKLRENEKATKIYHEIDPNYYSPSKFSFIGDIYQKLNYKNVADKADISNLGYPKLSPELIISENPDLIVLPGKDNKYVEKVKLRPGWSFIEAVKKSEILFLEGYLWDEGEPKKAFEKAINNANKVAMSLSDQFCVDRHKPHFLNLVKNKLDITFANEQEIMSLIDAKNFDEVINFGKGLKKLLIITRGEKGAISINGDEVTECGIQKNLKIVDLTGAGDLFAAGFLHGHVNGLSQKECLEKGTEMSSKVIQQIGARI